MHPSCSLDACAPARFMFVAWGWDIPLVGYYSFPLLLKTRPWVTGSVHEPDIIEPDEQNSLNYFKESQNHTLT